MNRDYWHALCMFGVELDDTGFIVIASSEIIIRQESILIKLIG